MLAEQESLVTSHRLPGRDLYFFNAAFRCFVWIWTNNVEREDMSQNIHVSTLYLWKGRESSLKSGYINWSSTARKLGGWNSSGWLEGRASPFALGRRKLEDVLLGRNISLMSPYHVTGWLTVSAESPERWCNQGLQLLGRGEDHCWPSLWHWKRNTALVKSRWKFAATICNSGLSAGRSICGFIFFIVSLLPSFLSLSHLFFLFRCAVYAAILPSLKQLRSDPWKIIMKKPRVCLPYLFLNPVNKN